MLYIYHVDLLNSLKLLQIEKCVSSFDTKYVIFILFIDVIQNVYFIVFVLFVTDVSIIVL